MPNLFIQNGKKVDKLSNIIRFLSKELGLEMFSPTLVRKIGATTAAKELR